MGQRPGELPMPPPGHTSQASTYNTATHTQGDIGLLPYAGEECVLVYHYMSFTNETKHWSLTYEIIPVVTES